MNYSNTTIYKLACKDPLITDIYVGHTTNIVRRVREHKSKCININSHGHNIFIYQFIRANGGWDNWEFIIIEIICCANKQEALLYEKNYILELKPTLNLQIPLRTHREYYEQNKTAKKQYEQQNKEHIAEYKKQYRENNKEYLKEYQKKYREQHKSK